MTECKAKVCGVCGERAFVNNFGARTCDCCKAFFRRWAVRDQESFECHFDGECEINIVTRKSCKRCRLNKCYSIGMRKELILNDIQRQALRDVVEKNRLQKGTNRNKCKDKRAVDLNITTTNDSTESINCENNDEKSLTEYIFNTISDEYQNNKQINRFTESPEIVNKFSPESKCTDNEIYRPICENKFYDIEVYKLTELLNIMKPFKKTQSMTLEMSTTDPMSLLQRNFDKDVKCFIDVIQRLNCFAEMCDNDRIALVKYGCVEIITIHSIDAYNWENESWFLTIDNISSVKFNDGMSKMDYKLVELVKQFSETGVRLYHELGSDTIIIELLTAIVLFSPNRPKILHKDVINFQQKQYIYLLQRYLRFKYSKLSEYVVNSMFARLMNTILNVRIVSDIVANDAVGRVKETPLLKEIFTPDLNS